MADAPCRRPPNSSTVDRSAGGVLSSRSDRRALRREGSAMDEPPLARLIEASVCLVGAVGPRLLRGQARGSKGFPRFTDRACAGPRTTRATCAWRRSGAASGSASSLRPAAPAQPRPHRLHEPGGVGGDGGAARRGARRRWAWRPAGQRVHARRHRLPRALRRAIDWAMVILNPLEPWPGELVLPAAAAQRHEVITRVVDYGGLFWDDVRPGHAFAERDHRAFRPDGWVESGRGGWSACARRRAPRADGAAARLPVEPGAGPAWAARSPR